MIVTSFAACLALSAASAPRVSSPQPPAAPTAAEVNRAMATGFNLGNTFDLGYRSTKLADIAPVIDLYAKAGMRHIRIPVTWGNSVSGSTLMDARGNIDLKNPRLLELDAVVTYALKKGLYVIVNTHHEHWIKDKYDDTPKYNDAFANLWTGIAKHFKNRSPKLILEVLNEPEGAFGDWSGPVKPFDAKAIALTRKVNEIGWKAIRAVSPTRIVMIGTNGQGNHSLLAFDYPTRDTLPGGGSDRYLIATVHTYDPWPFCGQDGSNSNWPGKDAIVDPIKKVADHGRKLGIPVNYGEFGVGRVDGKVDRDTSLVRSYYRIVKQTADAEGMSTTPWDDQGWFALTSKTGPAKYQFTFDIVPSMMRR